MLPTSSPPRRRQAGPLRTFVGRIIGKGMALLIGGLAVTIGHVPPSAAQERPPAAEGHGVAVLALEGATDAAWPLAQAVYARPALRPPKVDEARARVLAGEDPAADAPKEVRELAEVRAAIRGDDAPSRQLLGSMAKGLHLRAIVVVEAAKGEGDRAMPSARVFVPESSTFDAARYTPNVPAAGATSSGFDWSGAVASLERSYGHPAAGLSARGPAAPTRGARGAEKTEKKTSTKFYESPWFWGAIGAAALLGGIGYVVTRDDDPSSVHLQMQVPR